MMLLACLFMGASVVTAQTSKVTGLVISAEDGEPVIGATVAVKGVPTLGAITDIDGKFVIENLPSSAKTLIVSYVGMTTQEVTIHPYVKVYMQSDEEVLEEVMVVAYGTAKKSAFTGSAAVVDAGEIGKIQTSNAVNALNSKVAGIQMNTASGQPGATTPSIRIRGISSINAGNDPLIILDGAPYDGDLNNISTQDIESMSVLKDAASNALYGARGANGVIIITTKKGKTGKARITVDAKYGVNDRATRDYDFITSPAQYYEMYYGSLRNYYLNAGQTFAAAHANANAAMLGAGDMGLAYNVYTTPEGEYLIGANGKLNPNATLGNTIKVGEEEYFLTPDNWLQEAYRQSARQEYNVSASAGTDRSSFYASVSYLNNEGITANSDYERLTGRLKADYKLKDWMKAGANMSYTHYDANSLGEDGSSGSSGNIFAYATQMAPIYPLYLRDAAGKIMVDDNGFTMYDWGDGDVLGVKRPFLPGGNPYSANVLDTDHYEGNSANAVGFFDLYLLKGLVFTWNSGVTIDETRSNTYTNPYYGSYASSNGIAGIYHTRSMAYNHQQLLNYTAEFGRNSLNIMAGHEFYRRHYYYLYASKSNSFDPTNTELAGAITENGSNSYTTDYNTEGYFGRLQYDFDDKYFLSASYRRDASSRFHPENRWGNFWSAGAAWVINREKWFNSTKFDLLKLKASYGEQGNDNIGNYRYTSTYDIVNSQGHPAAVPSTLGNKDITWETSGNFNAGVDFEMFKSRFNGTIEYFNRKTTDMLFSFPLPPSYGYTSYYANVGDMANNGVEAEFKVTPIRTKNFEWNINLNLTHYKNKITYLPEERKTMECSGVEGYSSGSYYYGEGISLYTFRMPQFAGVDQETGEALYYQDVLDDKGNVTGRTTTTKYGDATNYLCGTALPDVYGGFGTSLSWKGFDLSVDFGYQIGGQVYDGDYAGLMSSPYASSKGTNFHKDLLNAWTPENKSTTIPRFQFGDEYAAARSDRFLTDASYLSLQNVNLGYTLPVNLTRKAQIQSARFYVSADNLFVWSQRKGLDPRQSITGSVTNSYYAPIRTISGGVTLTF